MSFDIPTVQCGSLKTHCTVRKVLTAKRRAFVSAHFVQLGPHGPERLFAYVWPCVRRTVSNLFSPPLWLTPTGKPRNVSCVPKRTGYRRDCQASGYRGRAGPAASEAPEAAAEGARACGSGEWRNALPSPCPRGGRAASGPDGGARCKTVSVELSAIPRMLRLLLLLLLLVCRV